MRDNRYASDTRSARRTAPRRASLRDHVPERACACDRAKLASNARGGRAASCAIFAARRTSSRQTPASSSSSASSSARSPAPAYCTELQRGHRAASKSSRPLRERGPPSWPPCTAADGRESRPRRSPAERAVAARRLPRASSPPAAGALARDVRQAALRCTLAEDRHGAGCQLIDAAASSRLDRSLADGGHLAAIASTGLRRSRPSAHRHTPGLLCARATATRCRAQGARPRAHRLVTARHGVERAAGRVRRSHRGPALADNAPPVRREVAF